MRYGFAFSLDDCEPEQARRSRMLVVAAIPLLIVGGLLGWLGGVGLLRLWDGFTACGCWQTVAWWIGGGIAALMLLGVMAFIWHLLFGEPYQPEPWEPAEWQAPRPPLALPAPEPARLLPAPLQEPPPIPAWAVGWRVIEHEKHGSRHAGTDRLPHRLQWPPIRWAGGALLLVRGGRDHVSHVGGETDGGYVLAR